MDRGRRVIDVRLRAREDPAALEAKVGKILGPEDYNLLLTGPATVRMPDGRPLAVYLPGVMREAADAEGVYDILHSLKSQTTTNRGVAGGTPRFPAGRTRSYGREIASAIVGAVDPQGQQRYCRLTSWTGTNLPKWQALQPFLRAVADHLAEYVPDRYAAQQGYADRSDPAWIVPGTPFSTITVNNSWPTGCHTDKGDLDEGFSTITCLRRGQYDGGHLLFPEYRVGVNLQHGDLILMDAHQWHANTAIVCPCGIELNGPCPDCGAERISTVAYFRTKVAKCGSPAEELERAQRARERLTITKAEAAG
jgi:Oxygenase domain of the 2OGFeDO superfamily